MRLQLSTLLVVSISTLLSLLSAGAIPADVRAVQAEIDIEARKNDGFCGLSPCPGKARAIAIAVEVEVDARKRKEDGFCGGYPCPGKLV